MRDRKSQLFSTTRTRTNDSCCKLHFGAIDSREALSSECGHYIAVLRLPGPYFHNVHTLHGHCERAECALLGLPCNFQ